MRTHGTSEESARVLMSRRQPVKADRDAAAGDECREEERRELKVGRWWDGLGVVVGQSRKCEACFAARRLGACLMALVSRSRSSHLPRLPPEDLHGDGLLMTMPMRLEMRSITRMPSDEYSAYLNAAVRCESFFLPFGHSH